MFWNFIKNIFSFTGVEDIAVWQDIIISAILIPIVLHISNWLLRQWNSIKPSKLLLKGFLNKSTPVLIFHSQMSGADNRWNFNPDQRYITRYPDPLPSDRGNIGIQKKLRIDPVLSQAESDCLSYTYNLLGKCGKIENIISADLIKDWSKWSNPIISVGFNPKTYKLIDKCKPIYFMLADINGNIQIQSSDNNVSYDAFLPNDAGVIQKTYTKNGKTPIIILAGLGTAGTEAAGYILNKNVVELGKMYGSSPFCAFIKVTQMKEWNRRI